MAEPHLDWSTAEVRDCELTVEIAGEPPDGWTDSFNATAVLLGGRDLGRAELREGAVHIDRVSTGDEERIRHFLEGVVQQANAAHQSPAEDSEEVEPDDEQDGGGESTDAQLTERFRSFAGGQEGREGEPARAEDIPDHQGSSSGESAAGGKRP